MLQVLKSQILQIIPIKFFLLDFSITDFLLINILALLTFISFIYFNDSNKNYLQVLSFFFAPKPILLK